MVCQVCLTLVSLLESPLDSPSGWNTSNPCMVVFLPHMGDVQQRKWATVDLVNIREKLVKEEVEVVKKPCYQCTVHILHHLPLCVGT